MMATVLHRLPSIWGPSTSRTLSSLERRNVLQDGLELWDFVRGGNARHEETEQPVAHGKGKQLPNTDSRSVYIETYGCQMNTNDTEVVLSILHGAGYTATTEPHSADVILLNTCAIRDRAESKIWQRLGYFKNLKSSSRHRPVVGVLGCMAERLKVRLLESDKMVDVVAGPDAYRDLPRLIGIVKGNETSDPKSSSAINVQLSAEESYADIVPMRPAGAISAFLSIMRGCNNMCAFCVVPFTRGRERSRPVESIVEEVKMLSDKGVKEVTLLGQNVNSYADFGKGPRNSIPFSSRSGETDGFDAHYAPGFKSVYVPSRQGATTFAHLLDAVARVDPEMRIRFTSPHPKDFADDVLSVMALHHNVCKQVHMPAQSGSTSVLSRMRRGYGREAYDALVSSVRAQLPGVALSTDMIAGFCGETEEEHRMSVDLLREHKYDQAFLFAYSEREKTHAARHFEDDVSQETKLQRLQELIETYRAGLLERGAQEVGRTHLVLVEGPSKRSDGALTGRTDTFKRVVFDDVAVPAQYIETAGQTLVKLGVGDYVAVKIVQGGGGVLSGVPLGRTTMTEFIQKHGCAVPL